MHPLPGCSSLRMRCCASRTVICFTFTSSCACGVYTHAPGSRPQEQQHRQQSQQQRPPGSGCTPTARRWWRWGHSLFIIAGRGHAQHSGGACHPRCSSHMTAASMVPCMSSALIASRRFTWHAAITNSMAGANGSSYLWVRGGDGGGGCRLCT